MNAVEEEMLNDILLEPFNQPARMIYGDWLIDNGKDTLGEMIHQEYTSKVWVNIPDLDEVHVKYYKGMVGGIRLSMGKFISIAEQLFKVYPIIEVDIKDKEPHRLSRGSKPVGEFMSSTHN
jgi:hypothetical protein